MKHIFMRREIRLRVVLVWLALCWVGFGFTQEHWGLTVGNYAGINGVSLNPASLVNFHQFFDVRLLSAGQTVENNHLYIGADEYRVTDLFSRSPVLPQYEETYPSGYTVKLSGFLHEQSGKAKSLFEGTKVEGPGILLVNGNMGYGFSSSARMMVSVKDLPEDVANFAYIGLGYEPQHGIDYRSPGFGGTGMAWNEYAFSLSRVFEDRHYRRFSAGITVKLLLGASGFYAHFENLDYQMIDRNTLDIHAMTTQVGIALPLDYERNAFPDPSGLFKGSGGAFDLGFAFLYKDGNYYRRRARRLCEQPYTTYLFRLGVSLLDIGFVRFRKNTMVHRYENITYLWNNISSYQYQNVNYLMNDLSGRFYGVPGKSYVGSSMTIYTPAAASLQLDYSFEYDLFLGAVWVHPLVFNHQTVRRPAQLALIPRYETPNVGIALPLSLYEYRYPRVGLSVRAYMLTIGTEKLGAFTGLFDFSGMDIYFSLKFSLDKGFCLESSKGFECGDIRFK